MAQPTPDKTPPAHPELAELLERAATIKRVSDDLVRQMNELASQILEAKVKASHLAEKDKR